MSKCVECGKPRRLPKKHYFTQKQWESDTYCSRACVEKAHGIVHLSGHTSRDYQEAA